MLSDNQHDDDEGILQPNSPRMLPLVQPLHHMQMKHFRNSCWDPLILRAQLGESAKLLADSEEKFDIQQCRFNNRNKTKGWTLGQLLASFTATIHAFNL